VILSSSDEISTDDLPLELRSNLVVETIPTNGDSSSPVSLDEMKKKQILNILEQTGWHQGKASEMLGISPSTLYRQLKSLGLTRTRRAPDQTL
jgi:transcriptional regulator of acetoin/glycerol metabolism